MTHDHDCTLLLTLAEAAAQNVSKEERIQASWMLELPMIGDAHD